MTREENELLTRTGPGTPMGNLMREYWIPAALSSELSGPDCPPLRVLLLGEKLIAFRDSQGRVGLLAEACPHRGTSLFFARNAECGLRCAYHGWKFDIDGQCLATPQEPGEDSFKHRVRAKSYPCRERGGLIWAYLGAREIPPPLPEIDLNMKPGARAEAALVDCNWLQCLEGDLDICHIRELHQGYVLPLRSLTRDGPERFIDQFDRTPAMRMETMDTDCGVAFALGEEIEPGGDMCWGLGQFMFPFFARLPQPTEQLGSYWLICRVPMDDTHTMCFVMFDWNPDVPAAHQAAFMERAHGREPAFLPNTPDWLGRFRYTKNPGNDFLIDRKAQQDPRSAAYPSGVSGQSIQDTMIATSMGPIADRSGEHLGAGDAAVIRVRERLLETARDLAERGSPPPGADQPASYRTRHGNVVLPRERSWKEALHP